MKKGTKKKVVKKVAKKVTKNTMKKVAKTAAKKPAKKVTAKKATKTTGNGSRKNSTKDGHTTLREFNTKHLPTVRTLSPKEIKQTREKASISQPIFAAYLNVSSSTVKKWETGEKKPHGASLKLLNVVAKNGIAIIS